jgi:hypothetical protein
MSNMTKWTILTCSVFGLILAGCAKPEQPAAPCAKAQPAAKSAPAATKPAVKAAKAEPAAKAETAAPVKAAAAAGSMADFEAFAAHCGHPAAFVPMVDTAPAVDGKMDEAYKAAKPIKFKFTGGNEAAPTAATTVYAISTADTLYLYFHCQTPDMAALVAEVRDHDGPVWEDDCVELFLDPANLRSADGYMHIIVNSLGTTAESKGPETDQDFSWNPKMTVKTSKDKDAWNVEMAIPFSELVGNVSKMDKVWAVNFNRMAMLVEGTEDTAWSPTMTSSSHVPAKFGCLWLQAGKVDNSK